MRRTLSLSAVQPLVVFVEDLHWCDVSTLELALQVAPASVLLNTPSPPKQ